MINGMEYVVLLLGALSITACVSQQVAVGGQSDSHGCLPSAGQRYSVLKQQCVQLFSVADIKLDDPNNKTLAVYVILSEDKSQAEMFWASHENPIMMDSAKGGYLSESGKIRLLRQNDTWKIRY